MDDDRARALAERLHYGQRDAGGASVSEHVRRVAGAVPQDARVVAWLHELFEYTPVSEDELLAEGLSFDDLRALRLVTRDEDSHSNARYLAHVELIARATGAGASVARTVKRADLADRASHPVIRSDGWSPPYELGLEILRKASNPNRGPAPAAGHTDGREDGPALSTLAR